MRVYWTKDVTKKEIKRTALEFADALGSTNRVKLRVELTKVEKKSPGLKALLKALGD